MQGGWPARLVTLDFGYQILAEHYTTSLHCFTSEGSRLSALSVTKQPFSVYQVRRSLLKLVKASFLSSPDNWYQTETSCVDKLFRDYSWAGGSIGVSLGPFIESNRQEFLSCLQPDLKYRLLLLLELKAVNSFIIVEKSAKTGL